MLKKEDNNKTGLYLLLLKQVYYDTARFARVYQYDVRAKQTGVCDVERAGFHAPAHASDYLSTDGQLLKSDTEFGKADKVSM